MFTICSYIRANRNALTWGAEDLSADVGSETNRSGKAHYTEPFRLVRSLCLFEAVAAGVDPIDAVFPAFGDLEGLRRECEEARRDGFTGKTAIHPAQVPIINDVFSPTEAASAAARAVVDAFAAAPSAGVINLKGEMLDRPHLTRAERLLKRIR